MYGGIAAAGASAAANTAAGTGLSASAAGSSGLTAAGTGASGLKMAGAGQALLGGSSAAANSAWTSGIPYMLGGGYLASNPWGN